MGKFLFGSAISSYQTEGNNRYADWWLFDRGRSGRASYFWEKWEEDIELLAKLGHNAFRFSIEWSRIQPQPGRIDYDALKTYERIINKLLGMNIEPILTLHHFTNPVWFYRKGGWLHEENLKYFYDYVNILLDNLPKITYYITINEPNVYAFKSYMEGAWIPQERSMFKALKVMNNMIQAHKQAYSMIKRSNPKAKVSLSQNVVVFEPKSILNPISILSTFIADRLFNLYVLDRCKNFLDFIGINYYTRARISSLGKYDYEGEETNCLGWEVYPEGLYSLLVRLYGRYRKPIMITENGICTDNDYQRMKFIKEHLEAVRRAISRGVDVIGYMYWSLLDNYEWAEGFQPRFGIVEVDYETGERRVRKSAWFYKELIDNFEN